MRNKLISCFNSTIFSCLVLSIAVGFMFCVFAPLDAFFTNRSEFWFSLLQLLPVLILVFICFTAIFAILLFLTQKSKAALSIYSFLLCVYLFFYIQGNYIPRNYGVLTGAEIDWSSYSIYGIISAVLALACTLLWIFSLIKMRGKLYDIGKYLCIFIMLIQVITICTLYIQSKISPSKRHTESKYVVTNKDLLNLSKNHNILVFVLDTFDSQDMLNLLEGDDTEEYHELFNEGFTYYPDTLGAYPTTKGAIPYILTGAWYYNEKPYEQYIQDAYKDNEIYKSLKSNHFSLGVYTEGQFMASIAGMYANVDTGAYYIDNYQLFARKVYQLVAFNYMPHQFKKYFNLDTGEFDTLKQTDFAEGAFTADMQTNYALLLEKGITTAEKENCFRFYHVQGIHPSYTFGKDLVTEEGKIYDVYDEAEGNCTYLKTFFDKMKEAGIYSDSTIIVMADHGNYNYSQNPLFMIKNAGETDGFTISKEEMSFEYLSDMFISLANGQKITEEYIQNCKKEGKRRYLYYTWDDSWGSSYLPKIQEMYLDGYAGDENNLQLTGQEYIGKDNEIY